MNCFISLTSTRPSNITTWTWVTIYIGQWQRWPAWHDAVHMHWTQPASWRRRQFAVWCMLTHTAPVGCSPFMCPHPTPPFPTVALLPNFPLLYTYVCVCAYMLLSITPTIYGLILQGLQIFHFLRVSRFVCLHGIRCIVIYIYLGALLQWISIIDQPL